MKALVEAVQAKLAPMGRTVHIGDAGAAAQPPYLVLSPRGTWAPDGVGLAPSKAETFLSVQITAAAGTVPGALMLLSEAISLLNPSGRQRWDPMPCASRVAHVTRVESGLDSSGVDSDVVILGTNMHPAYAVGTVRVTSLSA